MPDSHKKWVQEIFDRTAPLYGKKGCSYFDVFGKTLVSKTNLMSGERVLDIATGNGAVLFSAAEVVGEKGLVIGIDISSEMIAECQRKNIFSWVQLQVMDAENLNFPENYFDVVFCGFAVFFLPDIKRALAEIKRVLTHQGRFAASVWGNTSSLTQWVVENSKKYGATRQLKTFSIDNFDVLRNTLQDAGFKNIEIHEETATFWHDSAEAWWDSLWSHAIRSFLEQLSPNNLELLHQVALNQAVKLSEHGRIPELMHAIYAIGH